MILKMSQYKRISLQCCVRLFMQYRRPGRFAARASRWSKRRRRRLVILKARLEVSKGHQTHALQLKQWRILLNVESNGGEKNGEKNHYSEKNLSCLLMLLSATLLVTY